MKRFFKVVAQGLAVVAPLLLTVFILLTFISWIDRTVVNALCLIPGLEEARFIYGFGFLIGLGVAIVIGILARNWLISTVVGWIEKIVRRVPLVKLIYNTIRDMMGFVDSNRKSFTRCVLVRLPGTETYTPGFVTRETFADIPALRHMDDYISVYVSAAYGFMGMLVLVKRTEVLPLDMPVGDGLRFVLSGGLSASEEEVRRTADASLRQQEAVGDGAPSP